MKTILLDDGTIDLKTAINLAREEPLLLVTPEGQEFVLTEADDFEKEVETLRNSETFQRFLDDRSRSAGRVFSLDEIEAEVDSELKTKN
jgi:PHD/YefM family antitoxin component YafN of YafNO toxin-antitoxin module